MQRRLWLLAVVLVVAARMARADGGPQFDLDGPRVNVTVERGGKTLPIGSAPSLAVGDRLRIHADLPPGESVHYLLVVAFLRGSTNQPPDRWFFRSETWEKKQREGLSVTVPEGAEQAAFFLAPATGGDFSTLRNAVQGRPGAFVRAVQDLHQASLDRARLDTYLAAVHTAANEDPDAVKKQATLLARSLNIKIDQQCFDKPSEQQAPCLMQNPDALILDDGRSASIVTRMTTGNVGDMFSQFSYTQQAGGGYYSVYLGTIMDMARILDGFRTAQYQYLPALAIPHGDTLSLKLNSPPSFHKPQSVLVVGLPPVGAAQPPRLRAIDAKEPICVAKAPAVLAAEGAPNAFATDYAHDLTLRIDSPGGTPVELPVKADAAQGGFILDADALKAANLPASSTGTLHGMWGFDSFDGPQFPLAAAHATEWKLAAGDQHALIHGRKDTVHLEAPGPACVTDVTVSDGQGRKVEAAWKQVKPNQLQLDIPLEEASAEDLSVSVKQAGLEKADGVSLRTYSEAARPDGFTLAAGDRSGVLRGTRLDQVAGLSINGVSFSPSAALTHSGAVDALPLAAPAEQSLSLEPHQHVTAKVSLRDGRTLDLDTEIQPARPRLTLIAKSVQNAASSGASDTGVQLGDGEELPADARLTFAVQTASGSFARDEKIEVAGGDDPSMRTMLSVGGGGIVLQDAKTALVTLDPAKAFGASAFGPLRFRPVAGDGAEGDWQPLATLVRVPELKQLACASDGNMCVLSGANLFLIDSVAADAEFSHAVSVPEGFADSSLNVPKPDGPLFLKLRDDPAVVNKATLPIASLPASTTASTAASAKPDAEGTTAPPKAAAPPSAAQHAPEPKPVSQPASASGGQGPA